MGRVEPGNVVVGARHETFGTRDYTSARLKTDGLGTWRYGRMEARIQIPRGQGLWPAFWMLGDNCAAVGWPACGEIDIMENIGREPSRVHGTVHGPGYSGAQGVTSTYELSAGAFADRFHVYAVEWESGAIRWYVDDTLYKTRGRCSNTRSASHASSRTISRPRVPRSSARSRRTSASTGPMRGSPGPPWRSATRRRRWPSWTWPSSSRTTTPCCGSTTAPSSVRQVGSTRPVFSFETDPQTSRLNSLHIRISHVVFC